MPLIPVGPSRPVKTIDAAYAKAARGGVIELDRSTEHATPGLKVEKDGLTIRSAPGAGAPATIISTATERGRPTIEDRSEDLTLEDLVIGGRDREAAIIASGKGLSLLRCTGRAGDFRWLQIRGGDDTRVVDCDLPQLNSYAICAFDVYARGLLVERCTFYGGAVKSHTIRLQDGFYDLKLIESVISANGARSALNLRDGGDHLIKRCKIDGPISLGPLADDDGGLNDPQSTPAEIAKRDAKLNKSLKGVAFIDCLIRTNGITAEMGTERLAFRGGEIHSTASHVIRLMIDAYAPWRCVPTGIVEKATVTVKSGGSLFDDPRPDFHVGDGVTFNGAPTQPTIQSPDPQPEPAMPRVVSVQLVNARSEKTVWAEYPADKSFRIDPALALIVGGANLILVYDTKPSKGAIVSYDRGTLRSEASVPYTVGASGKPLDLKPGVHTIAVTHPGGEPAWSIGFVVGDEAPAPVDPSVELVALHQRIKGYEIELSDLKGELNKQVALRVELAAKIDAARAALA